MKNVHITEDILEKYQAVFDGVSWKSNDKGYQNYAVPSLVDGACGIGGYRESLSEPILRATRAIISLLDEFGVGAIRVPESSWAEYWHMQAISLDVKTPPSILCGGPVLVDKEPMSDRQRWIRNKSALTSVLDLAFNEKSTWINLRTESRDFASAVIREAHSRGLRVALRGPVTLSDELCTGDIFCGIVNLMRKSLDDNPVKILSAWLHENQGMAKQAVEQLVENGVLLTSELVSTYRNIFVKDSLKAPFLEENIPILPHVRYLLQMRSASGYLMGRTALQKHAGLAELSKHDIKLAEEGWSNLMSFAGDICCSCEIMFLGSGAPQLTTVPGLAMREEIVLLIEAGVPLETVLRYSTQLRCPNNEEIEIPGRWLATEVSPKEAAKFIMTLKPVINEDNNGLH